jgi:hypothetical protein
LDIPHRRTKAGLESIGDLVATSTTTIHGFVFGPAPGTATTAIPTVIQSRNQRVSISSCTPQLLGLQWSEEVFRGRENNGAVWTNFRHNYFAEAIIALIVILILLMMGLSLYFEIIPSQLATSISVLVTSLIFIGGTVYGKHKDRREAKRSRALSMFMEWHSPDMRASRIFASHYLDVRADGVGKNLPSLREVEIAAAEEYRAGNNTPSKTTERGSKCK